MQLKEKEGLGFLMGGGKMGDLVRTKDWSSTPIGSPENWPQSLRASVSILLNSRFPMFVWWGPEMTTIYNDAYIDIAGEKHPGALGKPGPEVWSEIWNVVGPMADEVMKTGTSNWAEDQILYINRKGFLEETYFTFSYSPVYNEAGNVGGVFCACTETTQHVLSARSILQSEQHFRSLVMQAPVAISIVNGPQHVIELANEHMLRLLGRTEAIIGQPILESLPEAEKQGLVQILDKVRTSRKPYNISTFPATLLINDQRETRYFDITFRPYYPHNDAEIPNIFCVAHNVTEQVLARKKVEQNELDLQRRVKERTEALEQQKLLIGTILDTSFNGIYALQAVRNDNGEIIDYQYLFANDKIAGLLNLKPEEVIGKSMLKLIPENAGNGFFDLFTDVLQKGEPTRGETHFVTDHLDNWYDFVIVPIDHNTVVVTTSDITQQKQATFQIEQQRNLLNNIMKHSPSGISVSEMIRNENGDVIDGRTIMANEISEKYLGIPLENILANKVSENDPQLLSSEVFAKALHTLATGEPFIHQYFFEANQKWIELSVARMDENRLINVFTDITPVKENHLQMERFVEELKRSNANLEEFAYAASHDLKEPIRKIQLFSDRLKDRLKDKLEEEDEKFFERMGNATKRMSALIDDLLLYSHVSAGAVMEEMVDLNHKLATVLEDLELELAEKKAVVNAQQLPTIKGHRRQLQQLLQNLVSNALKYSRPDLAPEINITVDVVSGSDKDLKAKGVNGNEDYYLIEFKDNGIGFEQEDAERIFNVFTRLHGNMEYRGTGVGLSIARKVVENHKGYIWADSEPGQGASFKILLPVVHGEEQP